MIRYSMGLRHGSSQAVPSISLEYISRRSRRFTGTHVVCDGRYNGWSTNERDFDCTLVIRQVRCYSIFTCPWKSGQVTVIGAWSFPASIHKDYLDLGLLSKLRGQGACKLGNLGLASGLARGPDVRSRCPVGSVGPLPKVHQPWNLGRLQG